jgi:hypothetical protein
MNQYDWKVRIAVVWNFTQSIAEKTLSLWEKNYVIAACCPCC